MFCIAISLGLGCILLTQIRKNRSCGVYRLVKGKNLEDICRAVDRAAKKMAPGPELDALKGWACHFAMHVLYALAQVYHPSLVGSCQLECKMYFAW